MSDLYELKIRNKMLKILSDETPTFPSGSFPEGWGSAWGRLTMSSRSWRKRGIIKIRRLANTRQRISYLYMLTPRGLELKAKISLSLLRRKISECGTIKAPIMEIASDLQVDRIAETLEPDIRGGLARVSQ